MYELIQLTERTYYIKSPTNIGLFRLDEKNVCLIDSGNDKDAGRRIRQVLDANGWQLTAIYNTHANADRIGGNRYLQGQTGCRIRSRSACAAAFLLRRSKYCPQNFSRWARSLNHLSDTTTARVYRQAKAPLTA